MSKVYLYNEAVVQYNYGMAHPFRLERLWLTDYLCTRLNLFGDEHPKESFEPASRDDLLRAHRSDYLDILEQVSAGMMPPGMAPYGLTTGDNPIFPNMWEYALLTAGGSLQAADLLIAREAERVFHPGGGLHHALPGRASGFCYVNDVVLAIHRFLDAGLRVFYVDIDAHHGDGVQEAFIASNQVMTVSVHQDGRTLFPGSGFAGEIGRGVGEGYAVNVGLLPHTSGAVYPSIFSEIIEPLLGAFRPDVLVTELGADPLIGDPLANLELTLEDWWWILDRLRSWNLPWLAVGGGGYELANAMRAWAMVWMAMIEAPRPEVMPPRPDELPGVAGQMRWPRDFWTPPRGIAALGGGDEAIMQIIAGVKNEIFSRHGL